MSSHLLPANLAVPHLRNHGREKVLPGILAIEAPKRLVDIKRNERPLTVVLWLWCNRYVCLSLRRSVVAERSFPK
jgi:hypothetical protein